MAVIYDALALLLQPTVLLTMLLASIFGLFVGAVPGLTAALATALLVPLTFFMEPIPAIAAIVSVTAMAIFAGDIPGALLRIPGTPASASYTEEAFALTNKGQAELALGTGLICSSLGGLFGAVLLLLVAPILAEFALNFSTYEYFWLACLGLTCAAFVSRGSHVKGAISLLVGLFLASVGLDPVGGQTRFTFGIFELSGGFGLVPVLIGLFAVSELLRYATSIGPDPQIKQRSLGGLFKGLGRQLWRYRASILRGCGIGSVIGALPGAGADISPYVSYSVARRFSKEPEKFGTGHVEGLASATAANNASVSGAYIPAIVFGIPGDALTAIAVGVLYMKGITPGPTAFSNNPELIYAVFISFFLANLLMIPLGYMAIKSFSRLITVPRPVLMPIILMFCIVGSFAVENATSAIAVMLGMGVVGYLMEENGFPLAPAILGFVLGPIVESMFVTSMMKAEGNILAFFERPLAAGIGAATLLIWFSPALGYLWRKTKERGAARSKASRHQSKQPHDLP